VSVPSEHLLVLAAILFAVGAAGFFLRRNVIVVLMCIELMLNAANVSFLAASRMHTLKAGATGASMQGPTFAIFVIVVAAVEAAVGLALVIALYRNKQSVSLEDVAELKD
jgi:NADH-quinone oxidoreductase subunit K